jgi:predicted metal-binding membrane protein
LAASTLAFLASAAATVWLCMSMRGGMPMPGGWTMSMAWMRMPGQSWPAAALVFTMMWAAMMVAMMLPALVPALAAFGRFRFAAAAAYFLVWIAIGAIVYPLGILWSMALMRSASLSRMVPVATAAAIVLAGVMQLTRWKSRQLACCTGVIPSREDGEESGRTGRHPDSSRSSALGMTRRAAFAAGIGLAFRCAMCCAGFMTILLVAGVMDLRVMGVVTAAITIERLAPDPPRVARALGILVIATGVVLIVSSLSSR